MRTPVTGQRLPPTAPGSAMAQHYPGTGPLPTSAMMVRYPGSAVAAHRLGARGMTPLHQSQSQPLPMTFQVGAGEGSVYDLPSSSNGAGSLPGPPLSLGSWMALRQLPRCQVPQ